jgi:hypothetical protein
MKEITAKHKAVIDAIISGETYNDACLLVYPDRKDWSKHAREVAVSKLLRLPHVKAYYDEQRAKLDEEKARAARDEALWSLRDSVDALKFVVKMAQKDAIEITKQNQNGHEYMRAMPTSTANAITGAVNTLNKMFGIAEQVARPDEQIGVSFIDDIGANNE